MAPGEPLDDVHMPNGSILPFLMSFGFFVAGLGFIYQTGNALWYIALYGGMAFAIGCMIVRSLKDDHGYYVPKKERSEEHTSELQSRGHLVCRLLLEKKKSK